MMLCLIFSYLVFLLTVCDAVDVRPIATVDAEQDVSGHNSCSSGTTDLECIRHQLERIYASSSPSLESNSVYPDSLSDKDVLFLKSRDQAYWHAASQDTLKQVLLIHRHGDRTPIVFPPKDNIGNESFWQLHGLGQLTNRGKARLHVLGKLIRQRYDKFLQGSVNKNARKTRSSGALRCIESAQVFLSSFMSLSSPNSSDAESLIWDQRSNQLSHLWQPASVNTLAAKYDALLNEGASCAALDAEYAVLDESEVNKKLLEDYKHERQVLEDELGFVVDHFYKWFWASSLLEVEESYFGTKFKPAVLAIYERLQEAGDKALVLFQTSLKLRRARVGLLLEDMIKNMVDFSQSSTSPFSKKFVHYSAHDINLVFLLGVFENIENFPNRPDYASNIILELHQENNEWFVKIFYMPHVPSKMVELHLKSCEQNHERSRCTLDIFSELMKPYRVSSWWSWMQECGNPVENMDPYEQNS